MLLQSTFNYGLSRKLNAAIVELPYRQPGLSMLIILPNDCDGLSEVEHMLTYFTFNYHSLFDKMYPQTVSVTIPKFSFRSTVSLNEPLEKVMWGGVGYQGI